MAITKAKLNKHIGQNVVIISDAGEVIPGKVLSVGGGTFDFEYDNGEYVGKFDRSQVRFATGIELSIAAEINTRELRLPTLNCDCGCQDWDKMALEAELRLLKGLLVLK